MLFNKSEQNWFSFFQRPAAPSMVTVDSIHVDIRIVVPEIQCVQMSTLQCSHLDPVFVQYHITIYTTCSTATCHSCDVH